MSMINLKIDGKQVEVEAGSTILDAARILGIHIPTMCYRDGCDSTTSCMVCVVKVNDSANFVPACGTIALEGMNVLSDCPEVTKARRMALELLLSDHVGDCMGPCQVGCPANMNIPLMIRQIMSGNDAAALVTVKKDIALPAVLGRICPAPCENICRRKNHDNPLSICLLKRYVADINLQSDDPFIPVREPDNGKTVAIIGSGPAGLSAAYYLSITGYECTVYEKHDIPGGGLNADVLTEKLPADILRKEIDIILKTPVKLVTGTEIGKDIQFDKLRTDFDAVFLASGDLTNSQADQFSLEYENDRVVIQKGIFKTNLDNVFAGGNVIGAKRHLSIRACADGKQAARSIHRYLTSGTLSQGQAVFNSRMGKLKDGEIELFLSSASGSDRVALQNSGHGLTADQARQESERCLHCDCRKPDNCKLRYYSRMYDAKSGRFGNERRPFSIQPDHPEVIYEAGKCIDCGLCIQIAQKNREPLGLTFIGRGFNVKVGVPFDKSIKDALRKTARQCAQSCPTGALSIRKLNDL